MPEIFLESVETGPPREVCSLRAQLVRVYWERLWKDFRREGEPFSTYAHAHRWETLSLQVLHQALYHYWELQRSRKKTQQRQVSQPIKLIILLDHTLASTAPWDIIGSTNLWSTCQVSIPELLPSMCLIMMKKIRIFSPSRKLIHEDQMLLLLNLRREIPNLRRII